MTNPGLAETGAAQGGRRPTAPHGVFRVRNNNDLAHIPFQDGAALVELPSSLLSKVRFKNDQRCDDDRLHALERSMRGKGYIPFDSVVTRIGQKGNRVIVDGGHRLTAARHIMREFCSSLFGPKVRNLYFLLSETKRSNAKPSGPK